MNGAGEVLSSLCRIRGASIRQSSVLGMIEDEVLHAKSRSESTGIQRSAMVLLIGLEYPGIGMKAERLAKQPIGLTAESLVSLIVGLVPQADKTLAIWQGEAIPELLSLGGADIKSNTR